VCQPFPEAGAPCVCVGPVPEPQRNFCEPGGGLGGCCTDDECAAEQSDAVCQAEGYNRQGAYCGGAAPPDFNGCIAPACAGHSDCAMDQLCVPAGLFGYVVAECARATCRTDADCDARAGGECRAFFGRCHVGGFACTYADDPCRTDADCPRGGPFDKYCAPVMDGTACLDDIPAP
ncbi:MAG: hypothetical protein KC583_02950, partial [Myxococcales bacterium]|nr:hypothetical protein [Myxococcales bacterium]